jgi:hypothetical protein
VCDPSSLFYVVHRTQQDSYQNLSVHRLLARWRSHLSTTISQAQGGLAIGLHQCSFTGYQCHWWITSSQKKKAPKTVSMQKQIGNFGTRFYKDDIDRGELLEGLSLLVVFYMKNKFRTNSFLFFPFPDSLTISYWQRKTTKLPHWRFMSENKQLKTYR